MRCSMLCIATASSLALAGCATRLDRTPEVRIETAPVAVAVGCVSGRPAPVTPLNRRVPKAEWDVRAPGAKAQAVRAQAGLRMNHADALQAATSGCPDAPIAGTAAHR